MESLSSEDLLRLLFSFLFISIFAFILIKQYIHKRKTKNLKYKWTWIVKKTKVSAIREGYDGDSSVNYVYQLESKDESWNLYRSDGFKNVEHGWHTLEEMKVKYDGVVYDLSDKDSAIRQLNDNINRLEDELKNNPWILKKVELGNGIRTMKNYIKMANEWLVTPYLIINGHKVSVWDSIDVYVNPDEPTQYYFDLDFTKQK